MKKPLRSRNRSGAISLPAIAVLAGASLLVVAGVLGWSASTTQFNQRQTQYLASVAAAESATEKVIAAISRDFQTVGEAGVFNNLPAYRQLVPTVSSVVNTATNLLGNPAGGVTGQTSASNALSDFEFSDAQGHVNQTYATRITSVSFTPLLTKLPGMSGNAANYRIIANARQLNTPFNSMAAVRQDVQVASIPVFQYQIFYAQDLELSPSANMTITGPVHCNGTIYLEPNQANETFQGPVTASRQIFHYKAPNDPTARTFGSATYQAGRDMRVNSLNLPIGTNNSSAALHGIIEIPPSSESTNSLMGQQRYYNKADLLLLVSNNTVIARSGAYNGFLVSIPWLTVSSFVNTNAWFFSKRENKTVRATEIDLQQFSSQYSTLTTLLGRNPKILYVADLRTQTSSTESGVRLINGQTLPSAGLTVATLNPLYIKGHYNVPSGNVGTTNTSLTVPASLVADAITVLSGNWTDINSFFALSYRIASSTTVNAGVIAGIVPTGNGYYSGGAENFFRFLENWSGYTLTFNGSMVGLYSSQTATAPWGASSDVYSIPQRNYALDLNFKNPAKFPPGAPELRTLIRSQWANIQPNSIQ